MDKLKAGLDAIIKYGFWVLTGVILLVSCGSWFMATAEMDNQTDDREGTLNSKFSSVQGIAGKPDLPNQKRIEYINEQHVDLKDNVFNAWTNLKEMQGEKNSLPSGLTPEFKEQFNEVARGERARITSKYLEEYQFFVLDHFRPLFKSSGIRVPAKSEKSEPGAVERAPRSYDAFGARPGARGTENENVKMVGVVDWAEADRDRVKQRFNWEKQPKTAEVVLAQEDLWVIEALLRAIKATNGSATEQYNAPITAIDALEIGTKASESWSASTQLIMMDTVGADEETNTAQGGAPSETALMEGAHGSAALNNMREGRYVGLEGKPLGANDQHPYAEFKMMPIRMSLFMDQTMVHKLLVACANSNMPIEIRKVRFWPGSAANLGLTPAMETEGDDEDEDVGAAADRAAMSYGTNFESNRTAHGGGGLHTGNAAYGGGAAEGMQQGEQPLHIPVELQGIIYIFNPPDKNKLGTGSAAEEQPQPPLETPPQDVPPTGTPTGVTKPAGDTKPTSDTKPTEAVPSDRAAATP